MIDLQSEWLRLLDDYADARRYEQSVAMTDTATKATSAQMTAIALGRIEEFQKRLALTWDMLVRCKKATCPNGDTALTMVLGEEIKDAIDHRIEKWHEVAKALAKEVQALRSEVRAMRKGQLARTA